VESIGLLKPKKAAATALLVALLLPLSSTRAQGPTIRSDVNLVIVEATVKGRSGQLIPDLKKEDFRLYEEGMQQEIAHFSRDELPLAVALVVDQSGSIRPYLRALRYASLTTLRTLKPEDQVALFAFSTDVELLEDLTPDKRRVADHFETLEAAGGTNINDALFLAADYLRKEAPKARRVIILISDNVPTDEGVAHPRDVSTVTLEADAVVYGIRTPGRNPGLAAQMGGKLIGHDYVDVKKIAAETGGEIFDVETEGSLFQAFQAVVQRLKTRYTLGYYPQQTIPDGRFRRLEVRMHPRLGVRGTDYTVLTKNGYYPPRTARARATP
jgi:Ca-activated chloride channel family protein